MKKILNLFLTVACLAFLQQIVLADEQLNIAVLDFEGIGISEPESRTLTNRLRTILSGYPQYQLIERGKMDEILKEQSFQLSGCTSNECVVEIGRLLSVEQMIAGSFGLVGQTYTIDMRIIDIESGKVVKTSQINLRGKIDDVLEFGLKNAVDKLLDVSKTMASVRILTIPEYAEIEVNGTKKGAAPILLQNLPANVALTFSASKPNYQTISQTLKLRPGTNSPVTFTLEHLKGKLSVTGMPTAAGIKLGRQRIGVSPIIDHQIETGVYQLVIAKPKYAVWQQKIEISAESPTEINFTLKPLSKRKAVARSVLFPGIGQFYQRYPLKGFVFSAASLALAYLSLDSQMEYADCKDVWTKKRDAYNHSTTQPDLWPAQLNALNSSFDKMKDTEKRRNLFLYGLGAVWTINLIEIAW
ncbi:MAG: PEGA domain-containing protein [archaeon]